MAQNDDLSAKLSEILNSPEQMQQIQSLAAMLGLGQGQAESTSPQRPALPADNGLGLDPAMLSALSSAFSQMGKLSKDDHGVALLLALKPLLGEQRRKRVDEAAKMLKLARMLPLLKDTGILSLDF